MKVQKLIGTLAIFSVLIILSIGIIPPSSNNEAITTTYERNVNFDDYDDNDLIDYGYFDEIGLIDSELSIIETERVFTESDQSLVEQFLDEQGLPSSSEKLGIEVQTALFDSNQKQYDYSNIVGIPQLAVTDDLGRVLDLGTIQTSFLAVTADNERTLNLYGTVEFYLDDDLITTKKIYTSESNNDSKTYQLSVIDSVPPKSFDRPTTFTFTLSDEGRDWENNSEHTYRVVLKEVNAEINSDNDFKKFSFNGENIVYELKVKVDEQKKIVLDENNDAISIFKSDSTLQVCGNSIIDKQGFGNDFRFKSIGRYTAPIQTSNPPIVTVTDPSKTIEYAKIQFSPESTVEGNKSGNARHWYGISETSSCSEKIQGIPRGTEVLFNFDTNSIKVKTPLSQKNYHLTALYGSSQDQLDLGDIQNFDRIGDSDFTYCAERIGSKIVVCETQYNGMNIKHNFNNFSNPT